MSESLQYVPGQVDVFTVNARPSADADARVLSWLAAMSRGELTVNSPATPPPCDDVLETPTLNVADWDAAAFRAPQREFVSEGLLPIPDDRLPGPPAVAGDVLDTPVANWAQWREDSIRHRR